MSAANISYRLRPNKYIDRQLFLELLSLLVPTKGPDGYAYLSMGGKHFVDHLAIYQRIGIRALYSFDLDKNVVARQNFNRPIDGVHCRIMESSALSGSLTSIMNELGTADDGTNRNAIIWLDYTQPSARRQQLDEFASTLNRLEAGDVIRITMNAHSATLGKEERLAELGGGDPAQGRLVVLRDQLEGFLPNEIERVTAASLPALLLECIRLAVAKAETEKSSLRFRPVLATTYSDGQRMVTATCLAIEHSAMDEGLPTGLVKWPFLSTDWSTLHSILAPDLSIRERLCIDEYLTRDNADIMARLGFQLEENAEDSYTALESYRRFHRYYPSFRPVEL